MLHFHGTKATTSAQVRESLCRCMRFGTRKAIDFMLKHGMIAHYTMPGRANVANRDIIEVALWAQYRAPFNVKSEH